MKNKLKLCVATVVCLCLVWSPIKAQAPTDPSVIIWVGSYTDASGTIHDDAATVPASIAIDYLGNQVGIEDDVFASPDALRSTLVGIKAYTPVGSHHYTIDRAHFPAVAGAALPNGSTVGSGIFGVCAQVATTTLDVPDTNTDGTPKLDADGKPVLKSWVAGWQMKRLDLVNGALTAYP